MKRLAVVGGLLMLCPLAVAGTIPLLRVGASGLPTPNLITPFSSIILTPGSGSTAQWGATTSTTSTAANSYSTSSVNRRVPLPFDGVVSNANCFIGAANTNIVFTAFFNDVTVGTVACNFSGGGQHVTSGAASDTVASGTLYQWKMAVSPGSWTGAGAHLGFTFTANGQHAAILGQVGSGGATSTTTWYPMYGGAQSGTETNVSSLFCQGVCGGVIHGFYVTPNVTEGGIPHNFALYINGAVSINCNDTASSSNGCCVNDRAVPGTIGGIAACTSTSPVTINPGDSISLQVSCPSSCTAATLPGFGIDFTPTTLNVVPVLSASLGTTNPSWVGLHDYGFLTSQGNYQMAPVNMTVSHYSYCTFAQVTGTTALTIAAQVGATGTAPTTPGGAPTVTLTSGSTGGCAGTMSGTYKSGGTSGATLALTAGQETDIAYTVAGTLLSTPMKYSAAVTVP